MAVAKKYAGNDIELLDTYGVLRLGSFPFLFDLEDLAVIQNHIWYRDKDGYLCAENVAFIDKKYIDDGEICIEWKNECVYAVYLKRDGVLYKFTPEQFR